MKIQFSTAHSAADALCLKVSSPINNSIDSSIHTAHDYACDGESSPDSPEILASDLPRDKATETKNEGKTAGRCFVALPWSFQHSPEEEIPNNHKSYQKNDEFYKIWHVRKKRIRDKNPERQMHVRGPTVAGTALRDSRCRVFCAIALAA